MVWDAIRDYPEGKSIEALVVHISVPGAGFKEPFTGIEFVCVEGGTFEMGDTFNDGNWDPLGFGSSPGEV